MDSNDNNETLDFFQLNDGNNVQDLDDKDNAPPEEPESSGGKKSSEQEQSVWSGGSSNEDGEDSDDTIKCINAFDDMGLKDNLLRGIYGYGFETPSYIQSRAIPPILGGRDTIVQSQSGTGKTGTFVISCIQAVDDSIEGCQGIIIAHTKELAYQVYDICKNLSQYTKIKTVLCIGGEPLQKCVTELKSGPIVVVGTPGRVLSLLKKRYLTFNTLKMFIIDEADEILSESFEEQIRSIFRYVQSNTQVCIFSATIPKNILGITDKFMNDPVKILIEREELTLDGISQFYINVDREEYKFDTLCDIFTSVMINQSIIYVNTINRAIMLEGKLKKEGFPISLIHSGMDLTQRRSVMNSFKSGHARVLISTDLLSRGIDIQQISIVINYDISNNFDAYLHRIGRSGRFGRKGVAINFITHNDKRKFYGIQNYYSIKIRPMPKNIQQFLG